MTKGLRRLVTFFMCAVMSLGIVQAFVFTAPIEVQAEVVRDASTFSWENATIYFMLTDRFNDGDPSNNFSYGRNKLTNGQVVENYKDYPTTFHGGDFAGITQKLNENYFTDMGVDVLWISAPYEQYHGFVFGGRGDSGYNGFPHYAYHGYYGLDWTTTDLNFGTIEEFEELVETAHSKNIRIMLDIVMNHPGYDTAIDINEMVQNAQSLGINTGLSNVLRDDWKQRADNWDGMSHEGDASPFKKPFNENDWADWWGADYLRSDQYGSGTGPGDGHFANVGFLPDFRTESTTEVDIPAFLQWKWKVEGRYDEEMQEIDAFLKKYDLQPTVRNYLIKWISSWVGKYGVDAFRVDTAKHVENPAWAKLKEVCVQELDDWRKKNPTKGPSDGQELDFWMMGEVWMHGASVNNEFFNEGKFDSIINFNFARGGQEQYPTPTFTTPVLDGLYQNYSQTVNSVAGQNFASYISQHDWSMHTREDLIMGGTALMLVPGVAQIYYGDETARPWDAMEKYGIGLIGYGDQRLRTDMNWSDVQVGGSNRSLLEHWRKLGTFRSNHIAIGGGIHTKLNDAPYTFSRTYDKNGVSDAIIAVIGATPNTDVTVDVSSVFPNGEKVTNAYTGATATVANGSVTFNSGAQGVILIEGDPNRPMLSVSRADGKPMSSTSANMYSANGMSITLSAKNERMGSAKYSINGGAKVSFSGTVSINLPSVNFKTYTRLEVEAAGSDSSYSKLARVYTFYRYDSNQTVPDPVTDQYYIKVHKDRHGWSAMNIYSYADGGDIREAAWPGKAMTLVGDYYTYTLPKSLYEGQDTIYILINHNGAQEPASVGFAISQGYGTYTLGATGDLVKGIPPDAPVLPDTSAFDNKLLEILKLDSDDYSAASWQNLQEKKAQAMLALSVLGFADADIAQQVSVLQTAVNALVAHTGAKTGALGELISLANQKVQEHYTAASWSPFVTARTAAQSAFDNPASQTAVDNAYNDLMQKMQSLVLDKAGLNALIVQANGKVQEDYGPISWQSFVDAKLVAQAVASNPNASLSQINTASQNLLNAIFDLVPKAEIADATQLASVLDEANRKQEAHYSAVTWAPFELARTYARSVYNNERSSQAQVDVAALDLQIKMDRLDPLPPEPVTRIWFLGGESYVHDNNLRVWSNVVIHAWDDNDGKLVAPYGSLQMKRETGTDWFYYDLPVDVSTSGFYVLFDGGDAMRASNYKVEQGATALYFKPVAHNTQPTAYESKEAAQGITEPTITVSWNVNGGTGSVSNFSGKASDFVVASIPTAPAYVDSSKAFVGWNTTSNAIGALTNNEIVNAVRGGARSFYAIWKASGTTVNKQGLSTLIAQTATYSSSNYSEQSWQAFTQARKSAQSVLDSPTATQSQVDSAYDAFWEAIVSLQSTVISVSKGLLQQLYNTAMTLIEDNYSKESWATFVTARTQAHDVLFDPDTTQAEVNAAYNELSTRMAQLSMIGVSKAALQTLYDYALSKIQSDYIESSWTAFAAAKNAALAVLVDPTATEDDVNAALLQLQNAMDGLIKDVANVIKDALQSAIDDAKTYKQEHYTAASYQSLQALIGVAQNAITATDYTQREIDELVTSLNSAIDALVDLRPLRSAIASAQQLNKSKYSSETWQKIQNAIADAEALLQKANASKAEIESMIASLDELKDQQKRSRSAFYVIAIVMGVAAVLVVVAAELGRRGLYDKDVWVELIAKIKKRFQK